MEISLRNLSKQPFSTGSGRIALKKLSKETIFTSENPQILGCRFLDVLVLIRGFLLYCRYFNSRSTCLLLVYIIFGTCN